MAGIHERPRAGYWASGDAFIWLAAGATALALILIAAVLVIVAAGGLGAFWPKSLERHVLADGDVVMGQSWGSEPIPGAAEGETRIRVRAGNRDVYGPGEFRWIDRPRITRTDRPEDAVLIERDEYGVFIGFVRAYERGGVVRARGEAALDTLGARLGAVSRLRGRVRSLEKNDVGRVSERLESIRLERRALATEPGADDRLARLDRAEAALNAEYDSLTAVIGGLRERLDEEALDLETADRRTVTLPVGDVYRVVRPNALGWFGSAGVYLSRLWTFVSDVPRQANLEGGILPAIFGTVLMTFLMTLAVVPLGVVAGLYLREYARQGRLVQLVRIAVNNLAGVPSIVFGIFGLGFFVYTVGGALDQTLFSNKLPSPTFGTGGILWSALTLALLTVPVVIVATEEGLAAVPKAVREGSLALGASKWETTWRVVLPAASPGILTGVILAISRAAGEVAPLMLTGAVKTATLLPVDGRAPFLHLERKFMHLGFHIYDLGFQSPNVEAAKPMVFMTTLLLVVVVVLLNVAAMIIRNRLWSRYRSSSF